MKRFLYVIVLFALLVTGCASASTPAPTTVPAAEAPTSAPEPRALTVFAAASLTDAFTEIGKDFQAANPGVNVVFNFGGSQTLRAQIEEGASADVFASANQKEMDALIASAMVEKESSQIFLKNKLVVILPANNPAKITSIKELANSGIKLVLAAEEVPVGKYSRQTLDLMNAAFGADFKDRVLTNVVSNEENVKQVVAKIQLGEADAGVVYTSDAVAAPELQTIEIPDETNVIAQYPIAALTESKNAKLAQAFVDYVRSPAGQATLKKWGFSPAP